MWIAIALVSFALVVPAQAQTYGTISAQITATPDLNPGSLVEITFLLELDDRGGTDSGLAGMDLLVSWDPAKATLSNISDGELWIGGAVAAPNDVNLDSDDDWGADYYSGDPPGPGVEYKILDLGTDTYIGEIPGVDGVAGTNLWTNQFQVTPGAGSVFFEGYQGTPADFSVGSEGSPYPFAHLALVLVEPGAELCLNLVIDTVGQLNSSTNTVDRLLFNMIQCPGSPFPQDQEVSTAANEFNEFEMGLIPEPSVFLLAGLGLLALIRRRRR
jgi:hypothetical protein